MHFEPMKQPAQDLFIREYWRRHRICNAGELINRHGIGTCNCVSEHPDNENEVFQYWIVDDSLALRLRELGEMVASYCDLNIWQRTQTGNIWEQSCIVSAFKLDTA